MNAQCCQTLELDSLKGLLVRHAQTASGRARISALLPMREAAEIERGLRLTTECRQLAGAGERYSLDGIEDPEPALAVLQVEHLSLSPLQILALERLAAAGQGLRERLHGMEEPLYPGLTALLRQIPDLRRLLAGVKGKILPDGKIDDNASPQLRVLRRETQAVRARIYRHLEAIMRSHQRAIQDEIITFRNDRFVIPVRTDSRSQISGVVHALSSSGQTAYMEPLAVVEQNNDLVRLQEEEQNEIARILLSLTDLFRTHGQAVRDTARVLTELDFAQAKALLSVEFACVCPRISHEQRLFLRDARHILLQESLRRVGRTVVPVSLELDAAHRVMVVSGPNAGGKTIVLKSIGLIALMAQMGLHVPAAEAELPLFAGVHADIGDQQSIAANLSTFTAHMRNISEMTRSIAPPALVLLDELGTGTDPDEGAALAIAILEYFRAAGAMTVATTHYNQLKVWAASAPGVINASVEFDQLTLRPSYRLILGMPGASAGLQIAERMDIPPGIVAASRARLDPRHLEANDYLAHIKERAAETDQMRRELGERLAGLEQERARLAADFQVREEIRGQELDQALSRVLSEFRAESERLLGSLKDRAAAERLKKAALDRTGSLRRKGAELRRRAAGAVQAPADSGQQEAAAEFFEPRVGDRVRIKALDKQGTVEVVRGDTYTVTLGPLRFQAHRHEIESVAPDKAAADAPPARFQSAVPIDASEECVREINVIGRSAEEAIDRIDPFIDAAFYAGVESLRIIHGHGKGILRRAIAQHLAGHEQVESFELAPPNQGGSGVTLIKLKQ